MVCVRGRGVNRGEGYPSELCLETSSAADTIDESNDQGEQSSLSEKTVQPTRGPVNIFRSSLLSLM